MPKVASNLTTESKHSHDIRKLKTTFGSECANLGAVLPSILRPFLKEEKNEAMCAMHSECGNSYVASDPRGCLFLLVLRTGCVIGLPYNYFILHEQLH